MNDNIKNTTKRIIEQNSQTLGSEINYQLKQARLKALDNSNTANAQVFKTWFIPATVAFAMAFYFMMPLWTKENTNQLIEAEIYVNVNDRELIEQLELAENLEFYEWLSQEEISSI